MILLSSKHWPLPTQKQGTFDEAKRCQQLSLPLQSTVDYLRARIRLKLYEKQQSLVDAAAKQQDMPATEVVFSDENSAPLLAPDVVQNAPRLDAVGGVSWTPDSLRLVHARTKAGTRDTELLMVDRASREVTTVMLGGSYPSCSPTPNGPIACIRTIDGQPERLSSQEIWLVNSDGSNLRKLSQGGSPSWTRDGRLFFSRLNAKHLLELRSTNPDDPKNHVTVHYEIEGYPTVSLYGPMVAYSMPGKLLVRRVADYAEILSLPLSPEEFVRAEWSPDGRFIVATSGTGTQPGVWLIEVASGQRRLLAKINGTRSTWSPDGRLLAVEESTPKKVVLLDVSSLDSVWKENSADARKQP